MWCLLLTFPNSSGWWTSHRETTHASGYYGAWPGWAVSVSVLPLTVPLCLQSSGDLTKISLNIWLLGDEKSL